MVIAPLLPTELLTAYAIAQASHRYPSQQKSFLAQQGQHYLNLKVLAPQQMVGFAITQVVGDEASLFDLALHPAVQRRGYAKQLLLALIAQLEERHVKTLWLEVRISNQAARALYQQLDFNEVSIRAGYYPTEQGTEDALILARTLIESL